MLSSKKRRYLTEINVIPYVDVMLVLLVIFMVTAPFMIQGIDVDLPEVESFCKERVGRAHARCPIKEGL